jgi:hypothetical protein
MREEMTKGEGLSVHIFERVNAPVRVTNASKQSEIAWEAAKGVGRVQIRKKIARTYKRSNPISHRPGLHVHVDQYVGLYTQ